MSSSRIIIKVNIEKLEIVKTFQLEPSSTIQDIINLVGTKIPEAKPKGTFVDQQLTNFLFLTVCDLGDLESENYGIFHYDNNDPLKSQWLKNEQNLDFYGFSNGDELIYRDKHRYLKVKTLDGSIKTVMIQSLVEHGFGKETDGKRGKYYRF